MVSLGNEKENKVLALKYRPLKFEEVIGQEETIRTLQSSAVNAKIGHALIFAGTRGCGKTTTARILAMFANCEETFPTYVGNADEEEIKPSSFYRLSVAKQSEPCGKCRSCEMILKHAHLAVTEIDAASNTGVDSVRELIESARYSTQGHRVFILDEAHMLSKNAFNSLLKILEEPPPNTTFILSTTEPHKLLPTVRSRCSIYEFNDVEVDTLQGYYKEISQKEDLDLSDEVLHDVAIHAEGSVRDGLTILQKYLSGESVESNASIYFDLVSALYQADVATALSLVSDLRQKEDGRVIIQTLEKWFYWCSLEHLGMKTPVRQHFPTESSLQFDLQHLQNLFENCLEIERSFSSTPNSKSVLEMGIIKLSL